jgi:hypothetical protein
VSRRLRNDQGVVATVVSLAPCTSVPSQAAEAFDRSTFPSEEARNRRVSEADFDYIFETSLTQPTV